MVGSGSWPVTERVGVRRAIIVGMIWVNGTAMLGMAIPWLMIGLLGSYGVLDRLSGEASLALVLGLLVAALPASWLGWSIQVPRWRLWAYRRVADIEALKSAAASASLIWPEGHFFERTEFRNRDQIAEMSRLEMASSARKASGIRFDETPPPTRAGTAGKSVVFGLILTPLIVLAPAGVLSFMGIEVTDSPFFRGILVLFPIVLATLIYRRSRRDLVSADEAFRRLLPKGVRQEDGEA